MTSSLLARIQLLKDTSNHISLSQLFAFVATCARLKNHILVICPSSHNVRQPPLLLPEDIAEILEGTCQMSNEEVQACWDGLKEEVWHMDEVMAGVFTDKQLQRTFKSHGGDLAPSHRSLWPPKKYCFNPECGYVKGKKGLKLQGAAEQHGVLYTKTGPLPILFVHITCHSCKTIYHPTFYVKQNPQDNSYYRYYYESPTLPQVIQLNEHRFADTELVRDWTNNMVLCHSSATNLANVQEMNGWPDFPQHWSILPNLKAEYILDGFKALALLEHHLRKGSQLVVLHDGLQRTRFDSAMQVFNDEIEQVGQPEAEHRCDTCVRIIPGTEGQANKEVFLVVCDGVTIGRPCCRVDKCPEPLLTSKARYCQQHISEESICSIRGCREDVERGFKTCLDPKHREAEERFREHGKSTRTLKERYEREVQEHVTENEAILPAGVTDTSSSIVNDAVNSSGSKEKKKDTVCYRDFGRKHSHNQQYIVAPCGMIISQCCFLHSEAFSLVAELGYHTFKGKRKPNHFCFDSNCILSKYIRTSAPDHIKEFYKDVGLPVDVFHFKSKHKQSDHYCGQHCNPYKFPELMTKDTNGKEKWAFNTSVCEQTNVWVNGFVPICREMGGLFYDFFLNVMVLKRNEFTKRRLENQGKNPRYWRYVNGHYY
ncbi:hypothetical protein VNI00_004697 [Paramarasmius palmivorus]|uniref:CxC5 like cysteine cluster associated with KDZ domain-containing protein n=1 Tax=Paramarasmius palmivorus TaxID=297713 RepID=A0AAW0DK09_9AGAR